MSSSPTSETGAMKSGLDGLIVLSSKAPRWVRLKNITRYLNSPESASASILNKHPRQSWPKDCSPAVYQTFNGVISPVHIKLPQESPIQFPQERLESISPSRSLSPVDSGSLSSQSTNASPGFIQRVISLPGYNWVILSQKPQKERPRQSLLIPSEVY